MGQVEIIFKNDMATEARYTLYSIGNFQGKICDNLLNLSI